MEVLDRSFANALGYKIMILITSNQNSIVKEIKSLKNRRDREEKSLFFVEGVRIVEEAIKENADVRYSVLTEDFISCAENADLPGKLEKMGCRNYIVSDKLFKEISDTETPQGILAVIGMKQQDLESMVIKDSLFVILDSLRDPGNMGAIIRTADAAGFTGVLISRGCVDVYNPKVLRSTMGSIFHIPVFYCEDIIAAIKSIKGKGIKIYASHLMGESSIFETDMTAGTAIIVGSEAEGISSEAAAAADMLVSIPMCGRAESLNASVAAGIIMYEAVRQRRYGR
jgi:RNA methyltransferase, TrmH family